MKQLESFVDHVRSASRLTRQLLGFARAGKCDPKATDLKPFDLEQLSNKIREVLNESAVNSPKR